MCACVCESERVNEKTGKIKRDMCIVGYWKETTDMIFHISKSHQIRLTVQNRHARPFAWILNTLATYVRFSHSVCFILFLFRCAFWAKTTNYYEYKMQNTNAIDASTHDTHHTQNDTDHVSNIFKEEEEEAEIKTTKRTFVTTENHKHCPMIRSVLVERNDREKKNEHEYSYFVCATQIRPYGSHVMVICSMKYYRYLQNCAINIVNVYNKWHVVFEFIYLCVCFFPF